MNREPMTAGGTQDAGAQSPQSEGKNEVKPEAAVANSSAETSVVGDAVQLESNVADMMTEATEISDAIDTAGTANATEAADTVQDSARVINYDAEEATPNMTVDRAPSDATVASAENLGNMTDMAGNTAYAGADNINYSDPTTELGNTSLDLSSETPAQNPGMNVVEMGMGDPSMNPGMENDSATLNGGAQPPSAEAEEEKPQPSPAVLSALQSMGADADTPATKSVVEPAVEPAPISTAKVAKRSHKGLVITLIILAVLLLALGGVAVWFLAFYNQPAKVAFDAVSNLVGAENVTTTGVINVTPSSSQSSTIQNVQVLFDSTGSLPGATNVTLSFDVDADEVLTKTVDTVGTTSSPYAGLKDGHVELKLGTVQMENGVIYLQISGIMASLENIGVKSGSSIYEEMEEYLEVIELIDDEWWEISIPDIIDSLGVDSTVGDVYKDLYNCSLDLLHKDRSAEVRKLLSDHPFIELEPISREEYGLSAVGGWNAYYQIDYNTTELAGFINAIPNTEFANEFYACYNSAMEKSGVSAKLSAEDFDEADASDFSTLRSNGLAVKVEISRLGHRLQGVAVNSDANGEVAISTALTFRYQSAVISAPESYRPITELVEEVTELYNTGANSNLDISVDDDAEVDLEDDDWADDEILIDFDDEDEEDWDEI